MSPVWETQHLSNGLEEPMGYLSADVIRTAECMDLERCVTWREGLGTCTDTDDTYSFLLHLGRMLRAGNKIWIRFCSQRTRKDSERHRNAVAPEADTIRQLEGNKRGKNLM